MTEKIPFDTALHTAVQYLKQQQLAAIPDEAEWSKMYVPSTVLQIRIDRILLSAERKEFFTKFSKNIARIAAVLIIVFTLLSAHPTVATAMKKIFSQTVVRWYDKYISVETKADEYPQRIKDFTVGYMADGFVLKEEYKIGTMIQKVYYNEELYLSIQIDNDDNSNIIGLDNEYTSQENIMIGGNEAMLVTRKDGYTALITSSNGLQIFIDGYVQSDEILKIYENIEIYL